MKNIFKTSKIMKWLEYFMRFFRHIFVNQKKEQNVVIPDVW